ncbi:MAG TPA: DUF3047 domain-containing protein [Geobacteraceae bacterium]
MKPVFTIIFFLLTSSLASGGELSVGKFGAGDLSGWHDKPFKGTTVYSLVKEGGKSVLKAQSVRSASGLIKEMSFDAKKYPLLRWSWKVEHSLRKEDVTKKSGDDFAARVYVVFPRTFFWRMRAINYVWAAKMPKDSSAPSPYTSNAMIVAVESGDAKAGEWVSEERNIYEDYKRLFGEEPPAVGAIAVMSDTDDTRDEVTAWYGDITVASPPKAKNGIPPLPADKKEPTTEQNRSNSPVVSPSK